MFIKPPSSQCKPENSFQNGLLPPRFAHSIISLFHQMTEGEQLKGGTIHKKNEQLLNRKTLSNSMDEDPLLKNFFSLCI